MLRGEEWSCVEGGRVVMCWEEENDHVLGGFIRCNYLLMTWMELGDYGN